MKKLIFTFFLSICSVLAINAQMPNQLSVNKIAGLDSSIASFTDVQKGYKFTNVYAVVNDLIFSQHEADTINIIGGVSFYSSVAAFNSRLQPISTTRVAVRLYTQGTLPGHYVIKQAFYKSIPK